MARPLPPCAVSLKTRITMTDIVIRSVGRVEALLRALLRTGGLSATAPNIRLAARRPLVPVLPQPAAPSVSELLPELKVLAVHRIGVTRAV